MALWNVIFFLRLDPKTNLLTRNRDMNIGSKPFLWMILKTWEKARYWNVIEPLCISRVRFGNPNRCVFTCACPNFVL
jgi:hypothetical protein